MVRGPAASAGGRGTLLKTISGLFPGPVDSNSAGGPRQSEVQASLPGDSSANSNLRPTGPEHKMYFIVLILKKSENGSIVLLAYESHSVLFGKLGIAKS